MEEGQLLEVTVSEPWNIVSSMVSPKISAFVKSASKDALIIHLGEILELPQGRYEWLLACPRHVGDSFSGEHGKLFCNLDSMTESQVQAGFPDDLSRFKGSLGLIGDVSW